MSPPAGFAALIAGWISAQIVRMKLLDPSWTETPRLNVFADRIPVISPEFSRPAAVSSYCSKSLSLLTGGAVNVLPVKVLLPSAASTLPRPSDSKMLPRTLMPLPRMSRAQLPAPASIVKPLSAPRPIAEPLPANATVTAARG